MLISSIPQFKSNYNNYQQFPKSRLQLNQLTTDHVSFSGRPRKIGTKYDHLLEIDRHPNSPYNRQSKLAVSQKPEILNLLEEMKDDKTTPAEIKRKILLTDNGGAFSERVALIKQYSDYDNVHWNYLIKRDDEVSKYNRAIVEAMLEAAPDDKTKHDLLLSRDKEWKTPLMKTHIAGRPSCDIEMIQILIKGSPDEKTLFEQVHAKDEEGNIVFWQLHSLAQKTILDLCTPEQQKEILTNPEAVIRTFNHGDIQSLLNAADLAKDKNIKKTLLRNLLSENENSKLGIGYKHYQNGQGVRVDAIKLLDATKDDVDLKKELLMSGLIKCGCNPTWFLVESPDQETLEAQLNMTDNFGIDIKDNIETPKDFVSILEKIENAQTRKEFLLAYWKSNNGEITSTSKKIKDGLDKEPPRYKFYREKILEHLGAAILKSNKKEDVLKLLKTYECIIEDKEEFCNTLRAQLTKQKEFLTNPEAAIWAFNHGDVSTLLKAADLTKDKNTKKALLKNLLTENSNSKFGVGYEHFVPNRDVKIDAIKLLEATKDDVDLKKELLMSGLIKCGCNPTWFLVESPDQETLEAQLNMTDNFGIDIKDNIETPKDFASILGKIENAQTRKEFLLASWKSSNGENTSTSKKIEDGLNRWASHIPYSEEICEHVRATILDESTTEEEVSKLLEAYQGIIEYMN